MTNPHGLTEHKGNNGLTFVEAPSGLQIPTRLKSKPVTLANANWECGYPECDMQIPFEPRDKFTKEWDKHMDKHYHHYL